MKLSTDEKAQLIATFGCTVDSLSNEMGKYEEAAQEEWPRPDGWCMR
jgi:hypothetical protein